MNINLEIAAIVVSIIAVLLGGGSLVVSIFAYRKTNQFKIKEFEYKEKELSYKEKELLDKTLERKLVAKSRFKTQGGSSGHDGEIMKFKNMDNKVRINDIRFRVSDGISEKKIKHVYFNKVIEKGEEIQLFIPRDGYAGNMDDVHYDITIYFSDIHNILYKQRYIRQDKKVTVDEEPTEITWESLIQGKEFDFFQDIDRLENPQ